jgi:DNA-binding MarR family transcriptional regulator
MVRSRGAKAQDDAKAILNRVRQLVRALRLFEKEAQARFGLGAAQMFILHVLRQQHDEISMNALADRTATDQSSVSLAVGRLVSEGYVARSPGLEDKRQVRLSLTAKGRAIVRRAPPAAQERILDSVATMPARDRAHLLVLLDRVIEGMGVTDGRAPMLFQDDAESRPPRPARRRTR